MNYRNQQSNCGCQTGSGVQYGRYQQAVPQAFMGGMYQNNPGTGSMAMPAVNNDSCNVVIVSEQNSCGMSESTDILSGMPLAMAYVPWQMFENLYSDMEGFKKGTIFRDLDFEFVKRGCN